MKGNEILLTTNPIFETTVILVNAMINCHKNINEMEKTVQFSFPKSDQLNRCIHCENNYNFLNI